MNGTYYCFRGEQHQSGCDCDCYICENERQLQKQIEFNRNLSARIKEKEEMAQDPECKKAYAEAVEIMKNLSRRGKRSNDKQ